jgi:hypothetical protein
MSSYALLPETPGLTPPGAVFVGKVARVIDAGTVGVTIDAYGDLHEWPPATWVAAGQVPVRGDVVLVLIDDAGAVWAFPRAAYVAPIIPPPTPAATLASLGIARGVGTITMASAASGSSGSIAHTLGVTPTTIVSTARPTVDTREDYAMTTRSRDATNFVAGVRITAFEHFGISAGTVITFDWVAIA